MICDAYSLYKFKFFINGIKNVETSEIILAE